MNTNLQQVHVSGQRQGSIVNTPTYLTIDFGSGCAINLRIEEREARMLGNFLSGFRDYLLEEPLVVKGRHTWGEIH